MVLFQRHQALWPQYATYKERANNMYCWNEKRSTQIHNGLAGPSALEPAKMDPATGAISLISYNKFINLEKTTKQQNESCSYNVLLK